jgi:hypothetical protein
MPAQSRHFLYTGIVHSSENNRYTIGVAEVYTLRCVKTQLEPLSLAISHHTQQKPPDEGVFVLGGKGLVFLVV